MVLKISLVVEQNITLFFRECNFLQLFYMHETSKMIGVKVVLIDVVYQSAKFYTTFLEHLVYRVIQMFSALIRQNTVFLMHFSPKCQLSR